MVAEVKMPALSPTMTEGKIVSWNKKEGDKVSIGDVILEVETDKAIMEVESQEKGTIGKILIDADNVVEVGKTIALILEKGETEQDLKNFKLNENTKIDKVEENINNQKDENNNVIQEAKNNDVLNNNIKINNEDKIFASPLAKSIAKTNNIDINLIKSGSGPNGRIIKEDIEKFLSTNQTNYNQTKKIGRNKIEYVDIEPTSMRKTIANRLTESKQLIPHWYLKISADMSNVIKLREEANKTAKIINDKPEFKISINDIIVMSVAYILAKHKQINSSFIDGKIRQYNNVDISVACSVEGGVLTPVVKNADQFNLLELSSKIKELATKARNGQLSPNDYSGGSITISNLGMYGVKEFTSIINPPQSCIIAVGAIQEEPVVVNNKIEPKPICHITFSADHRVIDGEILAKFSNDIKKVLENPALMIL